MPLIGANGGLIGTARTSRRGAAVGVWTPNEQVVYQRQNAWIGDANFANVSLLLHMDGANNSTTFTDSSLNALTVTANGDAKISTAQSKFGGASAAFDGTGDTLTVNSKLLDGTTWTAEAWIYAASIGTNNRSIFSQYDVANSNRTILRITNTGAIQIFNGAQGSATSSATISANTWYHIAFVRSSASTVTAYLDGAQVAQATNFAGPTSVNTMIGGFAGYSDDQWNGSIDEIRVTSIARYNANFAPPTNRFPDA